MLPASPVDDDEEPEEDPRAELLRRLLEYKSFRAAADAFELLPRRDRDFFTRPPGAVMFDEGEGPLECDLVDLLGALRDLLERGRQRAAVHEVEAPPLPLVDRMTDVLAAVRARDGLALTDLFAGDLRRAFIVVTFLAILHLAQEGRLRLRQAGPGEAIRLEAA